MIFRDTQCLPPSLTLLSRHLTFMLLQGNAAGNHLDGILNAIVPQNMLNLLGGSNDYISVL